MNVGQFCWTGLGTGTTISPGAVDESMSKPYKQVSLSTLGHGAYPVDYVIVTYLVRKVKF